MAKYPIKKEFFPYSRYKPVIGKLTLKIVVPFLRPPKRIFKHPEIGVVKYKVPSFDGKNIDCFLISSKNTQNSNSPCLIYYHGGGFVLPAANYHYNNAMRYAAEAGCKVWFVNYRLAPKYEHDVFYKDCLSAATYLYDNSNCLGIDRSRVGVGGDSAGGGLSVGVYMMLKDSGHPLNFIFQMLAYPFLDMRLNSQSNAQFTDTPMWNSKLSVRIGRLTKADINDPLYKYYSPVENDDFKGFPPAYIETAEFDCLKDDALLYARLLEKNGVAVELNQTKGTMHGFDIKQSAPTTKSAVLRRILFMKKFFESN